MYNKYIIIYVKYDFQYIWTNELLCFKIFYNTKRFKLKKNLKKKKKKKVIFQHFSYKYLFIQYDI